MSTYETLFITLPNLVESEEQEVVDALAKVIADGGATMRATERMGRRRLAYPIKKFDDGVYQRFLYDADAEVPKELERRIRLSDRVLRALTIRLDEEWAEQAVEQAIAARNRAEAAAAQKAADEAAAAEAAEVAAAEAAAAAAAAPPAEEGEAADAEPEATTETAEPAADAAEETPAAEATDGAAPVAESGGADVPADSTDSEAKS